MSHLKISKKKNFGDKTFEKTKNKIATHMDL
jgi:hypothetical protein